MKLLLFIVAVIAILLLTRDRATLDDIRCYECDLQGTGVYVDMGCKTRREWEDYFAQNSTLNETYKMKRKFRRR